MPSRDQIRRLLARGYDYPEIARRLGIPAGQAYLIGTGLPADGGDSSTKGERPRPGAQHLLGVPAVNPMGKESVRAWIRSRVAADPQMRAARSAADDTVS